MIAGIPTFPGRRVFAAVLALLLSSSALAQFTWTTGTIPQTSFTSGQSLAITGTNDHDFNAIAVTNSGTVNWSQGRLRSGGGGSITNSGLWNDSAGNSFQNDFGGSFTFTNAAGGTYAKSGAGTSLFNNVPFNNSGTVNVTGGTLQFQGGGTSAGAFTVSAGATVLFSNSYTLTNGSSLTGAGTYRATGGVITISDSVTLANFQLSGAALAGTHTLAGDFTWNAGNINSAGTTTIGAAGTFIIAPATGGGAFDHDFNQRTIVNNGTVQWLADAGRLRSGNNGGIVNNAQWNDAAGSSFQNDYGGSFIFTNAATGTYLKTGAGTTTFNNVPFNNAGTLNVSAGQVNLGGGGSFTGAGGATVAAGATLAFTNNYEISNASTLGGSGTYTLLGGTLTLSGTLNASGFDLHGGTLAGSQTLASTVPWTGTNLNTAGTTTIGAGGVFTISGGSDHDFNTRTLVNLGTVNWTQGRLRSGNGGSITNSGQWNDSSGSSFQNDFGGSYTFTNSATGTYTKTGTGTSLFNNVPFTNTGAVVVSGGTLQIHGGGSSSGTFNVATGAEALFSNSYTVTNGSALSGTGTYRVTGGTFTVSGNVTLAGLQLSGGALAGTHTIAGGMTWNGGDLNTAGTTTIGPGATFSVAPTPASNAFDHDFNTRTLVNNGTVQWLAGAGRLRSGNGGQIINNAQWNDAAGSSFQNDYGGSFIFTNSAGATYTKSGAGTSFFSNVPLNNNGTVAVTAGTLQLHGGGTNQGVVNVSAGANLVLSNSYTLASGSSLSGAGTTRLTGGTLIATGSVALGNFQVQGGTFGGTHTLTGNVTWNGGNLNATGTTTIAAGATFSVAPSPASDPFDHDFSGRTIVNLGTMQWLAGSGRLRSGSGGSITNQNLFLDSGGGGINNDFGGTVLTFTNTAAGTYRKTGSGTTDFHVPFINSGVFDLQAGTLALHASNTFLHGTSSIGAGLLKLAAGALEATGTLTFSNFELAGGTMHGTHTVNGLLKWTSGNFNGAGTTTIGGTLEISTGAEHDFNGHALVNNGTVSWTAGRLRAGGGATFTNNATFNDSSGSFVNNDYGGTSLVFHNAAAGVYQKSGANTTTYHVPFINSGTINVASGSSLALQAGGTFNSGAQFTGAGTVQLVSGLFTGNGNLNGTSLVLAGGSLGGTPSVTGSLLWNSGSLASGAGLTVTSTGVLTVASAADHDLPGHALVNQGTLAWTGGRLRGGSGATITNHGLFLDTSASSINNDYGGSTLTFTNATTGIYRKTTATSTAIEVPFVNSGLVDIQAGTLQLHGGGSLQAGSSFTGAGTTQLVSGAFAGSGTLNSANLILAGGTLTGTPTLSGTLTWNHGVLGAGASLTVGSGATLTVATGSDHDFPNHTLVNQGTLSWTAGRLRSGIGGTILNQGLFLDSNTSSINNDYGGSTLTFTNAAGATYRKTAGAGTDIYVPFLNSGMVDIQFGTLRLHGGGTFASGSHFTGAGTTQLIDGTFTGTGTLQGHALVLAGGSLSGTPVLAGSLTWINGTLAGGASLTVANGGTLTIASGADHDFPGHSLVNQGTIAWTGGRLRSGSGGTIVNHGLFVDTAGNAINSEFGGTVLTFTNAAAGTYQKSGAGTTNVFVPFTNQGTLAVAAGSVVFHSAFTNSGAIALSSGATAKFFSPLDVGTAALTGTGTIDAPSVQAGGTVSPGNSAGTLGITGNLTLLATANLLIQLGGPGQGSNYDFLSVGGNAVLNGNLSLSFLSGYQHTIAPASTFTVLTAGGPGGVTGAFANAVSGQRLFTSDGAGSFLVSYGVGSPFAAQSVVLSEFISIPEPSTWILLGAGALLTLLQVRRRSAR